MREDKKIGYSALVVGAISLWEAWMNIFNGQSNYIEIIFLSLGLVASLLGIALILPRNNSATGK